MRNLLIVGGGIAGMCLAIALRESGIDVEIAEISSDWAALGVGIALTAPSCRALYALGLLDRCIDAGWSVTKIGRGTVDGEITYVGQAERLLGPDYPASLGIMRPIFHQILAEAVRAAGARVRLDLTVTALEQTPDGVEVRFSDGSQGSYGLVVGADGINSTVRALAIDARLSPRFTGQSIWRATVPRPPSVEALVNFPAARPFLTPNVGFNPVAKDRMYVFVVQNTPRKLHVPHDQLVPTVVELLSPYGGAVARARDLIVSPEQVVVRGADVVLVPPPWYRGSVLLIGDAAHATTPHMASGACIAIEDAVVLAELIRTDAPLPGLLDQFMQRRFERCRMVVENSIQLGEWQKQPRTPGADPVALAQHSQALLAQPI